MQLKIYGNTPDYGYGFSAHGSGETPATSRFGRESFSETPPQHLWQYESEEGDSGQGEMGTRGAHPVASALIGLGISIVAIWSATFLPQQVMSAVETRTQLARPAAHSNFQEQAENVPATEATVVAASLARYHWHADCPLEAAPSLRPDTPTQRKSRLISRREAEWQGWSPCSYCSEIQVWRNKESSPARARFGSPRIAAGKVGQVADVDG